MKSKSKTHRFRRELLPVSTVYYKEQGVKLVGGGEWRSALCPFHNDTRPSLRVLVENGAFRCMACGVKGGNVLDFHILRYNLPFVTAARQLGAWEE